MPCIQHDVAGMPSAKISAGLHEPADCAGCSPTTAACCHCSCDLNTAHATRNRCSVGKSSKVDRILHQCQPTAAASSARDHHWGLFMVHRDLPHHLGSKHSLTWGTAGQAISPCFRFPSLCLPENFCLVCEPDNEPNNCRPSSCSLLCLPCHLSP